MKKRKTLRWHAAAGVALAFLAGAVLVRLSTTWGLPLVMLGAAVLLVIFGKTWWRRSPFVTTPWYRIVVVTVMLLGMLIATNTSQQGASPLPAIQVEGGMARAAYFALLMILAVPTAVAGELFLRGYLYSLLEDWRGAGTAVVGTAVVSAIVVAPITPPGAGLVLGSLVAPLLLAGSRWLTRSLVPALVAQGVMGLFLVAFLLQMAGA